MIKLMQQNVKFRIQVEGIQVFPVHLLQLCCIPDIFHNKNIENFTYNIKLLFHLSESVFGRHSESPTPANFTITRLLTLLPSPAKSRP